MGTVTVHVVPRGRTTECVGMHGDAVKIRLAAAPVGGAANAELIRYVAERLGVPRSTVELVAGALGRRKIVRVAGVASTVLKSTLLARETS